MTPSGESHRIYWQQWTSSSTAPTSRRECITSSAAVRISPAAQAHNVTSLLRQTLDLASTNTTPDSDDCLVLVGTLHSLPKYHVQFEQEQKALLQQQSTTAEPTIPSPYSSTSTDPFHVVYTLQPQDNCLECRKRMMQHLQKLQQQFTVGRNIIAPKLQWYYVPSADTTTIPNCIDLDGYATAMEDDHDDECDSDSDEQDSDVNADDEQDPWVARFPFLKDNNSAHANHDESNKRHRKQYLREQQRYQELCASCRPLHTFSGFLLKRDRKDPHVWRRMHCTLTDDSLWYTSRIYTHGSHRYARHGRIRLTRALLLEPASDYAPLYRTPFAFEVVSATGTSHIFRATSKSIQVQWIQAISDRIVESYENSLLEHAELIIADECLARNRRQTSVAVESLCHNELTKEVGCVLRWGMQVAEYRECCRHIQWALPAKEPVVVVTTPPRTTTTQQQQQRSIPLDPALQDMIRATWEQASILLTKATQVALQIQPNRKHTSIETLCRHIDYVITGRFRSSDENDSHKLVHHDPPPVDLFDPLLAELQSLASNAEHGTCNGHSSSNDSATNGIH